MSCVWLLAVGGASWYQKENAGKPWWSWKVVLWRGGNVSGWLVGARPSVLKVGKEE